MVQASASIASLIQLLVARHASLDRILGSSMIAVNMEYVSIDDESVRLHDGDEVAIIPPVSGG
eukprot:jgi/Hompol1/4563/HPOL_003704-RA